MAVLFPRIETKTRQVPPSSSLLHAPESANGEGADWCFQPCFSGIPPFTNN